MLKEILQGRPLKHPLHPLLVHLPIGLFLLSLFLDLGSRVRPIPEAARAAYITLLFGILTAVAAAVAGLADWIDIRADHPARKRARWHMGLNLCAVGLYGGSLALRHGSGEVPQTPAGPLLLSLAGTGLLLVSGYLGGTLVYDDGIGVGRSRRAAPLPRQTVQGSSADSPDGFVTVGEAAGLGDQETLRAEVDGVVLTVVRLDGQFHAFQEFCTHRYAPLSEGTFRDGQVLCPWHRSCFDVRSGKVTQGPAKVDLRTFEVRVHEGKLQVRVRALQG